MKAMKGITRPTKSKPVAMKAMQSMKVMKSKPEAIEGEEVEVYAPHYAKQFAIEEEGVTMLEAGLPLKGGREFGAQRAVVAACAGRH